MKTEQEIHKGMIENGIDNYKVVFYNREQESVSILHRGNDTKEQRTKEVMSELGFTCVNRGSHVSFTGHRELVFLVTGTENREYDEGWE